MSADELSKSGLQPGTPLGPYRIETRLGAGGMGEVFRAQDSRLGRTVAIKVIRPEFSQYADFNHRFQREARAISALNHPHICSLYDVGESDGFAYLVMEYVKGETLAEVLRQGSLPVHQALRYAVETADALATAHSEGIVHRDLKPANIMITAAGVKVLDFGLARRAEPVDDDGATRTGGQTRFGEIVGTVGYQSPEQAEGKAVDARSDVFSLGVVFYEMCCGMRPFRGDTTLSLLASILRETPEPPAKLRPDLPKTIERVILRCLEKKPEARFESARELHRELAASEIPAAVNRISSRTVLAVIALLLLIVAGVGGSQAYFRASRARWAEKEALPEVARLVDESRLAGALALLREAEQYIPNSPELVRLKAYLPPGTVKFSTIPDGAEIFIRDYADVESGDPEWRLIGRSPVETDTIPQGYYPRGTYRVRAVKPGFETVEWAVPLNGQEALTIELHPSESTPAGMVWVPGITELGPSQTSPAAAPQQTSGFWLDRYEVTNREFREFVDKGGYQNREYWKEPFVKEGKPLTWEQAMAEFVDPTGRPGPVTWQLGAYKEGQADFPVGGVSWYEAAAYAEFAGKQLPTVYHWYRAAGAGAPLHHILSFSNFAGQGPAQRGTYQGLGRFGNYDLAGNLQEWVLNAADERRYSLGGAWDTPSYQFGLGHPDARQPMDRLPAFGFRCARYTEVVPKALLGAVPFLNRDRRQDKPVDEKTYQVFLSLHAYDKTDLNASVDSIEDKSPYWRLEHVSFRAAYGSDRERVTAHLYIPKNSTPPYQIVAFMGGSDILTRARRYEDRDVPHNFEFIIRSGRALIAPAYSGTLDRGPSAYYHRSGEPQKWQEMNLQWSKDLGRSIDYLETRRDIDIRELAFLGISLGAAAAPRLVAVEPRFKAAILLSGGTSERMPPAVDPWNFAPRFTTPVLMLNGREDFLFPLETSQQPLYHQLGTPEKDKKHWLIEGGHATPVTRLDMVKQVLDWLDRYLGPVSTKP